MAYDFNGLADKMTMMAEKCDPNEGLSPAIIEQVTYDFSSRELAPSYFTDAPDVWVYTKSNSTRQLASGFGWIDDLFGMINEPVPGCLLGTKVGEVRNPQGELIYRHPEMDEWEKMASISSAAVSSEDLSTLYDIFGRAVAKPQAGCIYVQKGRKVIFGTESK